MKTTLFVLLVCGMLAADTVTYQYDDAGRLVFAVYGNGVTVSYAYDRAGNLLSRSTGTAGAPQIRSGGVVNGASYRSPLVRGEIATVFGSNLAGVTASAGTLPLPTTLGGVGIQVNGVAAPLYYVSPTQVNFQVPFETPLSGAVPVVVLQGGGASAAEAVVLAEYAPGIFTYARTPSVVDPVIVHGGDNSLVTPSNPASAGEFVVIYVTGVGSFDNPPATGAPAGLLPLARSSVTPVITVGGLPAQVLFSGLTPGNVGLVQINVLLPSSLAAGNTLPLALTFGAASAAPVDLYVR